MSAPAGPQAGRYSVVIDAVTIEVSADKIESVALIMQPLLMPLSKASVIIDRLHLNHDVPGMRELAHARLSDYFKAAGWSKPTDNLQDLRHRLIAVELETQINHAKRKPGRTFVKAVCPLLDSEREAAEAAYEELRSGRASQSAMAQTSMLPTPQPLTRDMPPPEAFPMDALGPTLSNAAQAIQYRVQCPDAIAALSVLAAASLAVQPHADVFLPTSGTASPLSLFVITVAGSGERKSTADRLALAPVTGHQTERFKQYKEEQKQHLSDMNKWTLRRDEIMRAKARVEDKERALSDLGPPPEAPLKPLLKCSEPTYEGLVKLFLTGSPSLGLFSDEGGHFLGGHAMKDENRLAMATGLSTLWDGSPIERVRASGKDDGEATLIVGRRLALHLMMQPDVSARLLSDPRLKDQGILSRLLVAFPLSTVGTRYQRPQDGEHASYDELASHALATYNNHMTQLLQWPVPLAAGERNELAPRALRLSREAETLCRQYADHIESKLGPNGDYAPIVGFANKMAEHACRIAGVITLFECGPNALEVPGNAFICATRLVDFFAGEALRLWDAAVTAPEVRLAKQVLAWLHKKGADTVELVDIYKNGPSRELRDKASAEKIVSVLVSHNHLMPIGGAKPQWQVIRLAA